MDTLASASSSSGILSADSCLSLASALRCVFVDKTADRASNRHHITLLIIPVALQLIASTSLIFATSGSDRKHLLLVAEGCVYFFLSLLEVISHVTPTVRDHVSVFKAIDQTIGALSFLQITFYMMFLYAFVRREVMPIIPTRIKRISQPLLLIFIPAVIAMNTVASFAGISYVQPLHVQFTSTKNHFVWTFFTALTLALLTIFQAACFCFAFYRLIRAFFIQRNIESASQDAAVLYRGIGWINVGIKLGAIETVIGYVYYGVTIAYVRRVFRLLSRVFLCIGIAKGVDETRDFEAIQKELKTTNGFRRSKVRNFISNPRLSTFRQLSPAATAFHAVPRAPPNLDYSTPVSRNFPSFGPKAHPYSFGDPLPIVEEQQEKSASPSGSLTQGLPGMSQFALIKAQRMSQNSRSNDRVTIQFHYGTPILHLRLSDLDMPSPGVIVNSVTSRPLSALTSKEGKEGWFSTSESNRTTMKEKSRFSTTTSEAAITIYPASTTHGDSTHHGHGGQDALYRHGPNPYGYVSSAPTSRASSSFPTAGHGHDREIATTGASGLSSVNDQVNTLRRPMPAYMNNAKRYSELSTLSAISADQAEIVNVPRRKVSFSRKSALAKAVFYPFPPAKVALALTEGAPRPSTDSGKNVIPQTPLRQRPLPQPQIRSDPPLARESIFRESIVDSEGNVITVTAFAPSPEPNETMEKRTTRALSGYSVGSVPETLQAVRELAKQFPGPPPGAVVANIGMMHITEETPSLRERGSAETLKGANSEQATRNRVLANGLPRRQPLGPLPPIPTGPSQVQFRPLPSQPQFAAPMVQTLDPFDDDTSYHGSELSPLSMSVKLRHPMSMISNMPTTAATSPMTPRFLPSSNGHAQSQEGAVAVSPGVVDFGTALNDWNEGADISPPPTAFTHRRSMSATTFSEIQQEQNREYRSRRPSDPNSSLDLNDGPVRVRSIRKSPRRTTPKPMRSIRRESMHLQPLVIPVASSSGRDVPISAVGGVSAVSLTGRGFSAGRRNVYAEEQEEESDGMENGRLVLNDAEVLSMVDGEHVPVRFHGGKKFF